MLITEDKIAYIDKISESSVSLFWQKTLWLDQQPNSIEINLKGLYELKCNISAVLNLDNKVFDYVTENLIKYFNIQEAYDYAYFETEKDLTLFRLKYGI